MIRDADVKLLGRCVDLAKTRQGFCAPNPPVGAVVVDPHSSQVLSEGVHWRSGADHAEVVALKQLNGQANGAFLFVSLEPCSHHGQTPPCVDAIKRAGISRVIFAYLDPNPVVKGRGQALLLDAGIDAIHYPIDKANQLYRAYNHWHQYQRPWVNFKIAMTLDGAIAGENGEPKQLTGRAFQQFVHQQRFHHDAILTTAATIINDNPSLNVRLPQIELGKDVFIIDRCLKVSAEAQVLSKAKSITFFHGPDASINSLAFCGLKQVKWVAVPLEGRLLDLGFILNYIGRLGVHALWVEAGSRLYASCLEQGHVDQLLLAVSPQWLLKGLPLFHYLLRSVPRPIANVSWRIYGDDALCQLQFDPA